MNIKDTFKAISVIALNTYGNHTSFVFNGADLSIEQRGYPVWSHSMRAPLQLEIDLEFGDVLRDYHFKRMARLVFDDYVRVCEAECLSDNDPEGIDQYEAKIEWAKKELGDLLE